MKITIENQEYELDLDKAVKDGYLKKIHQQITDFSVGDVFLNRRTPVVIIETFHSIYASVRRYNFIGLGKTMKPFSDFDKDVSHQEMLDYLNKGNFVFQKNINAEFGKLISE
jgi:hypothetical protein